MDEQYFRGRPRPSLRGGGKGVLHCSQANMGALSGVFVLDEGPDMPTGYFKSSPITRGNAIIVLFANESDDGLSR
ncbi:hypothetical protein [Amycolatopsis sp. lyj-23]|uniref:hypothetical protein n=1 Tax=Amycolatopsis sp. lyj-23 TaxID=2789283 RepID=UPI00397C808D